MRTTEKRDALVAKVQATFASYSTLGAVPKFTGEAFTERVTVEDPASGSSYVAALYKIFERDPEIALLGRVGSDLIAG